MRSPILFLLILLYACSQRTGYKDHVPDPAAVILQDSATSAALLKQDYKGAIVLLDEAIRIDNKYYSAYRSKFSCQIQLKQFDQAEETAKKLKQLKQYEPGYYVAMGILHYFKNDSVSSDKYLKKAVKIFDKMLDTAKVNTSIHEVLRMNRAMVLILTGQEDEGRKTLFELSFSMDEGVSVLSGVYANKTKEKIFQMLIMGK